jgi:hypothetical protein
MFFKQKVLRALFSRDGQRMEISPIHTDEPAVICYPRIVDISFTEGVYVDTCQYTIQLEADVLLDNNNEIDLDGSPIFQEGMNEVQILQASGRFIESYSDSWSLEVDDSNGESKNLARSYRISRNLSATGKDHYGPDDLLPFSSNPSPLSGVNSPLKKKAWEQARDFVHFRMKDSVSGNYPNVIGKIGSGIVNLVNTYEGYSHTRTENIGIDDGTYSISENWLLSSGKAYENYNMSISTSIDNPFVNVSINGEINGLSSLTPDSYFYGGPNNSGLNQDVSLGLVPGSGTPYKNALDKYYKITNSGKFGVGCDIFKRANNSVAVELNAQPKSITLGLNEYDGSITYALDFDNRPTNILSGVLAENINITDTYPGDVFATIPIIGRRTGPVLQFVGGRTEYRRDLNLDFTLDYTDIPYGSGRKPLLFKKPSLNEPLRSQLINLIKEVSPEKELGIRKWFLTAPVENWVPKTGQYSLNLSWTYELNR